jgi:hypothetical protein
VKVSLLYRRGDRTINAAGHIRYLYLFVGRRKVFSVKITATGLKAIAA